MMKLTCFHRSKPAPIDKSRALAVQYQYWTYFVRQQMVDEAVVQIVIIIHIASKAFATPQRECKSSESLFQGRCGQRGESILGSRHEFNNMIGLDWQRVETQICYC